MDMAVSFCGLLDCRSLKLSHLLSSAAMSFRAQTGGCWMSLSMLETMEKSRPALYSHR